MENPSVPSALRDLEEAARKNPQVEQAVGVYKRWAVHILQGASTKEVDFALQKRFYWPVIKEFGMEEVFAQFERCVYRN